MVCVPCDGLVPYPSWIISCLVPVSFGIGCRHLQVWPGGYRRWMDGLSAEMFSSGFEPVIPGTSVFKALKDSLPTAVSVFRALKEVLPVSFLHPVHTISHLPYTHYFWPASPCLQTPKTCWFVGIIFCWAMIFTWTWPWLWGREAYQWLLAVTLLHNRRFTSSENVTAFSFFIIVY